MKKKNALLYPGITQAEKEREKASFNYGYNQQPDFIGNAPNYEKFKSWNPEKVLAFLNID